MNLSYSCTVSVAAITGNTDEEVMAFGASAEDAIALFLKSGLDKISDYAGTQQYMASAGIPFPALLLPPTMLIELLGGLSLLLGYKARIGAIVLFLFLIPTTLFFILIFHNEFKQSNL